MSGVQNATVCTWRQRYSAREPRFPASVVDLAMGRIYGWPQVQQWLIAAAKPETFADAGPAAERVSTDA